MEMGADPMMGGMPPMNPPMDNADPMMDDEELPQDEPMGDDMGDENEPMEDPKKEIQSKTGELCQSLREYNDEQENPDTDLNKYVLGMILKQASKDMTDDEKKEIISKLKGGFDDEDPNEDFGDDTEMGGDDDMESDEEEMPMEQIRITKQAIREMLGDIMNDKDDSDDEEAELPKNVKKKNNPFVSNR